MAMIELHPVFKSARYTNGEVDGLLAENVETATAAAVTAAGDAVTATIDEYYWQPPVIEVIADNTVAPGAKEVVGNRYILAVAGGAPHADYDGAAAGDIVEFRDGAWEAFTPEEGWCCWNVDADMDYVFTSGNWKLKSTGAGADAFLELDDTPAAYTDKALHLVRVNAGADGLEFTAAPAIGASASGTALPTGGNLVTGQVFHLTAADDTAKAPPGLYVHDGTGWLCLGCLAAYAFGNLGATPSLSMIAGAAYTMVVDQEITSATVALSRPGIPVIFRAANAGGDAVAVPTMTARTTKTVGIDAITGALSTGTIWDDGTYLWITCGEAE